MSTNGDRPLRMNLKRWLMIGGGVFGLILASGTYVRIAQSREIDHWTASEDIPTVGLIAPVAGNKQQTLELPGRLEAFYSADIYARVPGYVKAWYKDIGAHVKQGDLLAEVDTPELDQQIAQAEADLDSAISAKNLAQVTAERWRDLLKLDAVSKQDTEEKTEDLAHKTALADAATANLKRLEAMKDFARIVAPFDGLVTRRGADIGALVTVGQTSGASPLFSVADTHRIRAYIQVPQSYSSAISPDMKATLTLPEYPDRSFSATLVTTSNAISAQSGTLLVELDADNPDGALKPGGYAQVSFNLPLTVNALQIPSSALMFRQAGLQVATVGADGRIVMKRISVGRDLGTSVEIASGLTAQDRVVDNPPDSLDNGDQVRIASGTTQG